jgi:hypothetical protein
MPASDAPAAALHHLRQHQLTTGEYTVEVHLDRRADGLRRLVEKRTYRHHTGVVDQHIDVPAAVGTGLVEKCRERFLVGHVQGMTAHLSQAADAGDRALEHIEVPVTDDHAGTARQQRLRGRIPDAAGSAGDDDALAPDVVHSTDFTGVKSGAEPTVGAEQGRRVRAPWPACGCLRAGYSSLVSALSAGYRAVRQLTFTYLILSFCSDNKSERLPIVLSNIVWYFYKKKRY